MIKKVLARNDKKFYWKAGDAQNQFGVVKEEDIKKAKGKVTSHTGNEFFIYDANFVDQLKKVKRGPQTLVLKDLGYILIHSGVDKNSLVVDAGAGCGVLACVMGRYAKKVVSYEMRKDHLKIAEKNIKFLGAKNVTLKEKDVYEGIDEKNVDVITLDLPEPWKVDFSCLKNGGTFIAYLPTIKQVMDFSERVQGVYVDKVVELIEREWFFQGRKVRPKSDMLGHTAFLVVGRKI